MAFLVIMAVSGCRSSEADPPRGDPTTALRHYQAATADDEAAPAAWFGVYLANRELGDTTAAADAKLRVRQLVPEAEVVQTLRDPDIAPHPISAPDPSTRPRP